eukprot:5238731-Lingulodinium_polyedra.AAC.1
MRERGIVVYREHVSAALVLKAEASFPIDESGQRPNEQVSGRVRSHLRPQPRSLSQPRSRPCPRPRSRS